MASLTREVMNKRRWKQNKQGRDRKVRDSRKSTPSATELFGGLGEPGQPVKK